MSRSVFCHVPAATHLLFDHDLDIPIRTQDGQHNAHVPKYLFARLAGGCQPTDGVTISSTISRKTFDLFVCHCQGKAIDIPLECLVDMIRLTDELNMDELRGAINNFRKSENNSKYFLALDILESPPPQNIDALEEQLADSFLLQVQNPIFLSYVSDLGLDLIKKVFARNDHELVREHIHEVFDFMILCVDKHFGNDAAVLFEKVAMSDLNVFETFALLSYPRPGRINGHRIALMNRVTRHVTMKRMLGIIVLFAVCCLILLVRVVIDEIRILELEKEVSRCME